MLRKQETVTVASFSEAIIRWGCVRDSSLKDTDVRSIVGRISKLYSSDAKIYDKDSRVITIAGKVVEETNENLQKHSRGEVDPFTKAVFAPEVLKLLSDWDTNNVLHASHLNPSDVEGFKLPEGKTDASQCQVAELRAMVSCRGGNGVSERGESINKPELVKIVKGFQLLEEEMPRTTVVYDRNPETNGLFLKCKEVNGKSIPGAVQDLLNDPALKSNNFHAQIRSRECAEGTTTFEDRQVCE